MITPVDRAVPILMSETNGVDTPWRPDRFGARPQDPKNSSSDSSAQL
jgi:hypothetical protein